MASNVFVVDSSFKRTQVKVTPGKYLREVLEEACKSRKLTPENYELKTAAGKAVDLSQPFRLSGLSAGAKLQLTQASRSPSVVSVALQLPESEGGGRLSDKYPSTTSLWQLLRKTEEGVAGSSQKRNFTQRGAPSSESGAGRLLYEQPCLHVMNRNLESFEDLQKTLAQLGLNNGSVLIRLSFKNSGRPLEEAMQEISQYFSSIDGVPAGIGSAASQDAPRNTAVDGSVRNADADNAAAPAEGAAGPEPNEDTSPTSGPTATVVSDDVLASSSATLPQPTPSTENAQPAATTTNNGISVYRPPTNSTPAAALAPDDPSVFEPTLDHAKAHQAALERAGKNKRLLSDRELEAQETERQQKLATVQSVQVRVRYPDQYNIDVTITASETGADLYAKVRPTLQHASEPFELRYLGAKGQQVLPNSSTQRLVRDFGFRGRVLVTLVWAAGASMKARSEPSLKAEFRSQAQELKVDLASQQAVGAEAHREAMAKPEKKDEGKGKGRGDVEAKMKKFLGFGKK